MPIINSIAAMQEEMTAWRRDIHAHPETAFEEVRTAGLVAKRLRAWGIEVHEGIAETGVVGVLRGRGESARAIGLRADMDALPMTEETGLPYQSTEPGRFHGCGHDGHTTMLLGAAKYLAETRNFDGTVHFIFQPAEEGAGGGRLMVEEGLFDRFPCDHVFALHNWPGLPVGKVAVRSGSVMAASDEFHIVVRGRGGHAAMPHNCVDPVVVAAQVVGALQTLVSRVTDPLDAAVVSVTKLEAGVAFNIIPEEVRLSGTARTFKATVQAQLEAEMQRMVEGIAAGFGATAELRYVRGYPATVNPDEGAEIAAGVAAAVVGAGNVVADFPPTMGAEDFSFMLMQRPGAYIQVGAADDGGHGLHNPHYDFNDEVLPIGTSLLASLVETRMKRTDEA